MLVKLKDQNDNLVYKDLCDIDLDVGIQDCKVKVNSSYFLFDEFSTPEDASLAAKNLVSKREEIDKIIKVTR